jgi:AcrR family transcriptional regulator
VQPETLSTRATAPKRRRRGELRGVLIEAARDAFVELGYHGASLRHIAARANTTQAMLYRHFPTKAKLFEESVFNPFAEFVGELVGRSRADVLQELGTADVIARFTRELYEFTATHRGLMLALIAADAHGDEDLIEVRSAFRRTIEQVLDEVKAAAQTRGWSDIDFDVAAPVSMATIISSALLDDWLFPPGPHHPGTERILGELARYEVRAITGQPLER